MLPQRERRDEQLPEARRTPKAGEVVEEALYVGGAALVRREEAEVLVRLRGHVVVVPRAEMDITPEHAALAPNHERRLAVDLQRGEAVHDVHPRLLERARP